MSEPISESKLETEVPQVKARIVPIEVSGVYKRAKIKQEFSIPVPPDAPNDQIILFIWEALSRTAGLTVSESESEYKFYPFSLFKEPLTARIKPESGVRL